MSHCGMLRVHQEPAAKNTDMWRGAAAAAAAAALPAQKVLGKVPESNDNSDVAV